MEKVGRGTVERLVAVTREGTTGRTIGVTTT
jgi:hypothetical protein